MKRYALLMAAVLTLACTTKFKEPEDGDTDSGPDTLADTDVPVDGTDPLADGADLPDLPADGDEEDAGPVRSIVLVQGTTVERPLGNGHVHTCNVGDGQSSNLRTLLSSNRLYVATSYNVPDATPPDKYDCAKVRFFSLPDIDEVRVSEICNDGVFTVLADGSVSPVMFENEEHVYVFEAVNDRTGGDDARGNVRGYRLDKDQLDAPAVGYVFDDPWSGTVRDGFTDLHVGLCGEQAHVIVRTGESSPGGDSDYYGFTLANDASNGYELDKVFDEGATRSFGEAGHFIDSAMDPARSIHLLGSECRERSLMLAGQEFEPGNVISSLIIDFDTDLIRSDSYDWSEIGICTSETCLDGDEPAIEGMLMILLDRPPSTAVDKLFGAWISNEEPFGTSDLPPSLFHAGGILFGSEILPEFTSAPVTAPDDPDHTLQPFPVSFDCSTFRPHYFKTLYDPERDVLFITGIFNDIRPDEGTVEAMVAILALDGDLAELAPPFFMGTGLPVMLGYEAALDAASGTLYFVWFDYNPETVTLDPFSINAMIERIKITPVSYHDAD
jgi:hypothetical protein